MKLELRIDHQHGPLLALLSLIAFFAMAQPGEAQLLGKLRSDYGKDSMLSYAPDDPTTRSRVFNLQTGHAGAFYNCDGEEDKRYSPHICWGTGKADLHGTFWDVLRWRQDRNRIVQRICDGAGACCQGASCQGKVASGSVAACDCAPCDSGSGAAESSMSGEAGSKLASPPWVADQKRNESGLLASKPKVGLIAVVEPREDESPVSERSPRTAEPVAAKVVAPKVAAEFAGEAKTNPAESKNAIATPIRTSSLLDRARSSRQLR